LSYDTGGVFLCGLEGEAFVSTASFVPGSHILGFLSGAALSRYVIVFLLAFVGLSFVVSLVAFLPFIFTVPLDTSHRE
jgi:hypothetical protein